MLSSLKRSAAQALRPLLLLLLLLLLPLPLTCLQLAKTMGLAECRSICVKVRVYISHIRAYMCALVGCPSPHTPRDRAR